jgi:hypothetical protein
MAENLNTRTSTRTGMARVNKWEVIDNAVRAVIYLAIIYLFLKFFKVL